MPDKEKFMYAAICFGNDARHDCRECDYYIRTNCVEYCDERRIVRDALELLKEPEPVQVVWKFGFPHCPECGQMLPEGDRVKYCLHCGKPVIW